MTKIPNSVKLRSKRGREEHINKIKAVLSTGKLEPQLVSSIMKKCAAVLIRRGQDPLAIIGGMANPWQRCCYETVTRSTKVMIMRGDDHVDSMTEAEAIGANIPLCDRG